MGKLIILEGLIGAGKSTLTDQLGNTMNYRVMKEPVEKNPYLTKFYADPKRWALEMQFWLMSHRYEMHQDAIKHIWRTGQSVIMDRSIYGDAVFCKKNHEDGNIDKDGYENYMKMRQVMTASLMVPQITVYLKTDPKKCLDRISKRGRDCEQTIPIDYLEGLDRLYMELMDELKSLGSNITLLDWNDFLPVEEVIKVIRSNGWSWDFTAYPKLLRVETGRFSFSHPQPITDITGFPTTTVRAL